MPQTIAIIDYGSGNLRSAAKAFDFVQAQESLNASVIITDKADDVARADKIVLPGQGAFADCMNGLSNVDGMIDILKEKVLQRGTPFFGICVGMQLMATQGKEYVTTPGLGWIGGDVVKIAPRDESLKIPHMGWNQVTWAEDKPVWWKDLANPSHLYFVHSYYPDVADKSLALCSTDYGVPFIAGIAKKSLMAVQFHPEKSHTHGLQLLENFMAWDGRW